MQTTRQMLGVLLATFLLLTVTSTIPVFGETKPPKIESANVEKTKLYRGLQTLRGIATASDPDTPTIRLRGKAEIVYADSQRVTIEPLPRVLDSQGLPTGPFVIVMPVPESAGTGVALLTITIRDPEGNEASQQFTLEILDHRPFVEKRSAAQLAIGSATALITSLSSQGVNVTSAEAILGEARRAFEEGEFLKALEDVEGALAMYTTARDKASLAEERAIFASKAHSLAREAAVGALAAIERARAYVATWRALGADVKVAEDLLRQAEDAYKAGLAALQQEAAPGAAASFSRAEVLAGFATRAVDDAIELWKAAAAKKEKLVEVRERLISLKGELDSVSSLVAALAAAGVDVRGLTAIIKWADESIKTLSRTLTVDNAPAVEDSIQFVLTQLGNARDQAVKAASSYAREAVERAKAALAGVKGLLLAPDTGYAEALISAAEKAVGQGEYLVAIARAQEALTEIARLQGAGFATSVTVLGSILAIVVAVVVAAVLLLRRPKATPTS